MVEVQYVFDKAPKRIRLDFVAANNIFVTNALRIFKKTSDNPTVFSIFEDYFKRYTKEQIEADYEKFVKNAVAKGVAARVTKK